MKEATGELNMTVVTVLAIAAIGALFYTIVWPIIRNNIEQSTRCANAVCDTCNGKTAACVYYGEKGAAQTITCPCKD